MGEWMKTKHIDDVLATGLFIKAKMIKVLVEENGWYNLFNSIFYRF